ncbi:hypothetical protein C8R47DRAFT_1270686 [Mycena vitilis]|nr:hypothetical protein C8R47DRAFT_1270686 [Mycena vitilis]
MSQKMVVNVWQGCADLRRVGWRKWEEERRRRKNEEEEERRRTRGKGEGAEGSDLNFDKILIHQPPRHVQCSRNSRSVPTTLNSDLVRCVNGGGFRRDTRRRAFDSKGIRAALISTEPMIHDHSRNLDSSQILLVDFRRDVRSLVSKAIQRESRLVHISPNPAARTLREIPRFSLQRLVLRSIPLVQSLARSPPPRILRLLPRILNEQKEPVTVVRTRTPSNLMQLFFIPSPRDFFNLSTFEHREEEDLQRWGRTCDSCESVESEEFRRHLFDSGVGRRRPLAVGGKEPKGVDRTSPLWDFLYLKWAPVRIGFGSMGPPACSFFNPNIPQIHRRFRESREQIRSGGPHLQSIFRSPTVRSKFLFDSGSGLQSSLAATNSKTRNGSQLGTPRPVAVDRTYAAPVRFGYGSFVRVQILSFWSDHFDPCSGSTPGGMEIRAVGRACSPFKRYHRLREQVSLQFGFGS